MSQRGFSILVVAGLLSLLCLERNGDAKIRRMGETLSTAIGLVDQNYLENVDAEQLHHAAMEGIVSKLDEHSNYFARQEAKNLMADLERRFGGVGIQVRDETDTKRLQVSLVMPNSPAGQAGVRSGDVIVGINGENATQMSSQDALSRIRGEVGDPVVLTLERAGEPKPFDVEIIRAEIKQPTVLGDLRAPGDPGWSFLLQGHESTAYVRVTAFSSGTPAEIQSALQGAMENGAQGVILDLRNDPGGYLGEAVETCSMFLPAGTLVLSTRNREGQIEQVYRTEAPPKFPKVPLVVLMNRYSASASEIVAACLQDHGRATIVGERSYGKGTVQKVYSLGLYDARLKVTTASYWRPSGRNIHRLNEAAESDDWGVLPDDGCDIRLGDDQFKALLTHRQERDLWMPGSTEPQPVATPAEVDPQLVRAVEALRQKP